MSFDFNLYFKGKQFQMNDYLPQFIKPNPPKKQSDYNYVLKLELNQRDQQQLLLKDEQHIYLRSKLQIKNRKSITPKKHKKILKYRFSKWTRTLVNKFDNSSIPGKQFITDEKRQEYRPYFQIMRQQMNRQDQQQMDEDSEEQIKKAQHHKNQEKQQQKIAK